MGGVWNEPLDSVQTPRALVPCGKVDAGVLVPFGSWSDLVQPSPAHRSLAEPLVAAPALFRCLVPEPELSLRHSANEVFLRILRQSARGNQHTTTLSSVHSPTMLTTCFTTSQPPHCYMSSRIPPAHASSSPAYKTHNSLCCSNCPCRTLTGL